MNIHLLIAYLHLLTFGIGFYSIWARANTLKKLQDSSTFSEVFKADNLWGLAAILWIATGFLRAFGGLEKGTEYYLHSTAFILKMCLFILIILIEIFPMVTLIKWRIQLKKGETPDVSKARLFATLSHIELGLLSIMLLLAAALARGL